MVHKFLFKTFFGALLWYTASLPPFQIQIKSTLRFRFHSQSSESKTFLAAPKKPHSSTSSFNLLFLAILFGGERGLRQKKINYKFIIIRCFVLEINCLPLSLMPSRCSLLAAMIFGAKFKDKKVLLSAVLLLFLLLFLVIMQSSGAHRRSTARGEFLLIKNYEPQRNCFRLFIRSTNLPPCGHVIQLRKSLSELSH